MVSQVLVYVHASVGVSFALVVTMDGKIKLLKIEKPKKKEELVKNVPPGSVFITELGGAGDRPAIAAFRAIHKDQKPDETDFSGGVWRLPFHLIPKELGEMVKSKQNGDEEVVREALASLFRKHGLKIPKDLSAQELRRVGRCLVLYHLYLARRDLFRKMTEKDANRAVLRALVKRWRQVMKTRKAVHQSIASTYRDLYFLTASEEEQAEGEEVYLLRHLVADKAFAEIPAEERDAYVKKFLVASDPTLEAVTDREQKLEKQVEKTMKRQVSIWDIFGDIYQLGAGTAAWIYCAIGDIRNYPTANKLIAYSGWSFEDDGRIQKRKKGAPSNWSKDLKQATHTHAAQLGQYGKPEKDTVWAVPFYRRKGFELLKLLCVAEEKILEKLLEAEAEKLLLEVEPKKKARKDLLRTVLAVVRQEEAQNLREEAVNLVKKFLKEKETAGLVFDHKTLNGLIHYLASQLLAEAAKDQAANLQSEAGAKLEKMAAHWQKRLRGIVKGFLGPIVPDLTGETFAEVQKLARNLVRRVPKLASLFARFLGTEAEVHLTEEEVKDLKGKVWTMAEEEAESAFYELIFALEEEFLAGATLPNTVAAATDIEALPAETRAAVQKLLEKLPSWQKEVHEKLFPQALLGRTVESFTDLTVPEVQEILGRIDELRGTKKEETEEELEATEAEVEEDADEVAIEVTAEDDLAASIKKNLKGIKAVALKRVKRWHCQRLLRWLHEKLWKEALAEDPDAKKNVLEEAKRDLWELYNL